MCLVDMAAGEGLDERVVPDLIAEAGDHGGDLGVEDRGGDCAEHEEEDFHVLPAGVEHFYHVRPGEEGAEGGEVDALGLRVHHRDVLLAGELHQAELGVVGTLAHEFGVEGDEFFGA